MTKLFQTAFALFFGMSLTVSVFAQEGARELLQNGAFAGGALEPWQFLASNGATGTCKIVADGPEKHAAARIEISTASLSGEAWSVQFQQTALDLRAGKKYRITLQVQGSNIPSFVLLVGPAHAPWGSLPGLKPKPITPTAEWQKVSYEFSPESSEPNARILFYHYNFTGAVLNLADVSLVELP